MVHGHRLPMRVGVCLTFFDFCLYVRFREWAGRSCIPTMSGARCTTGAHAFFGGAYMQSFYSIDFVCESHAKSVRHITGHGAPVIADIFQTDAKPCYGSIRRDEICTVHAEFA